MALFSTCLIFVFLISDSLLAGYLSPCFFLTQLRSLGCQETCVHINIPKPWTDGWCFCVLIQQGKDSKGNQLWPILSGFRRKPRMSTWLYGGAWADPDEQKNSLCSKYLANMRWRTFSKITSQHSSSFVSAPLVTFKPLGSRKVTERIGPDLMMSILLWEFMRHNSKRESSSPLYKRFIVITILFLLSQSIAYKNRYRK